MALGEFELIKKYFNQTTSNRSDVILGIGDDCALLQVPNNHQLAVTTDTLVCGTHFLPDAPPHALGHKSLAANISDLAAMGATPAWISLALTLPDANEVWLKDFCEGMFELATKHNMQLIGGDTTSGPLSLTISVYGFLPLDQALRRNCAKDGDFIYVTGNLGDSKAGLDLILEPPLSTSETERKLINAHYYSTPNTNFASALLPYANTAIDISDGLISDLGHILKASQQGADIWCDSLPLSNNLQSYKTEVEEQIEYALTSGEEYELCFTSSSRLDALQKIADKHQQKITQVGIINKQKNEITLWETKTQNKTMSFNTLAGYNHFK